MNTQWGPAALVVIGYLVSLLFQRHQIQDLGDEINHHFEGVNGRFEDLHRYLDQQFKNVEDRLERLQHPVLRG